MDVRLTQLLASRLCHDLVGASGAVNAGVELIDEMGPDDGALNLLGNSARQLSARLAFFRMAFGGGGGKAGQPLADARAVFSDYVDQTSATLDWAATFDGVDQGAVDLPRAKLLLNMALLAQECLVRGGEVQVRLAAVDGGLGAAISATGTGAAMKADTRAALAPSVAIETITPHTIQAYFTAALARQMGGALEVGEDADRVELAAIL